MTVRVFIASVTPYTEIKKQIQRVLMILDTLGIDYERVDLAESERDEDKEFMKENARQRYSDCGPLPPQFFNGNDYCGDYEDFDQMNDDNRLYEFLKLQPPPSSKKVHTTSLDQNSNQREVEKEGVVEEEKAEGLVVKDEDQPEGEEKPSEVDEEKVDGGGEEEGEGGEEKEAGPDSDAGEMASPHSPDASESQQLTTTNEENVEEAEESQDAGADEDEAAEKKEEEGEEEGKEEVDENGVSSTNECEDQDKAETDEKTGSVEREEGEMSADEGDN